MLTEGRQGRIVRCKFRYAIDKETATTALIPTSVAFPVRSVLADGTL